MKKSLAEVPKEESFSLTRQDYDRLARIADFLSALKSLSFAGAEETISIIDVYALIDPTAVELQAFMHEIWSHKREGVK